MTPSKTPAQTTAAGGAASVAAVGAVSAMDEPTTKPISQEEDDEFLPTVDSDEEDDDDDFEEDLDFAADFESHDTTKERPFRRALGCILAFTVFVLTAVSLMLLIQALSLYAVVVVSLPPTYSPLLPITKEPSITTTSPSPNPTSNPTINSSKPLLDDDSPILSISDPRYGAPIMNISAALLANWNKLVLQRVVDFQKYLNKSAFVGGDGVPPALNLQYDAFCLKQQQENKMPVKYVMPKFPLSPLGSPKYGLTFDPSIIQKHLRQYRYSIAEFYEHDLPFITWYPPPPPSIASSTRPRILRQMPPQPPPSPEGHNISLQRLATKFYSIIKHKKKLILGFQGSSVMSGQDNCHDFIYSEQIRRTLQRLFDFANVSLEIRNMGQNGDGPDMPSQMLCAPDTMNSDLDLLFLWYPMIPNARFEETNTFLMRQFNRGVHVYAITFPYTFDIMKQGVLVQNADKPWVDWYQVGDYARAFNWIGGTWGRHGDGRCHIKTREGAPGVFMQNWHFGPLGFQLMADSAVNLYVEAMELTMDYLKMANPPLSDDNVIVSQMPCYANDVNDTNKPLMLRDYNGSTFCTSEILKTKLLASCATGYGPRYSNYSDLKNSWYVELDDASNPFGRINSSFSKWSWKYVKGSSRGPGAEGDVYKTMQGLNCAAFPDIGYAFDTSGSLRTEWITFRMLPHVYDNLKEANTMRVLVCTGSRKGPWGIHPEWTVRFGVGGKEVGEPIHLIGPFYFSTCHVVAKGVAVPKVNEIFGFYFDWGSTKIGSIFFQTVALLGEVTL